jgi:hypothetical protein
MYTFSQKSIKRLITCHKDLQLILEELIEFYDFSVLEGLDQWKDNKNYINKVNPN